MARRELEMLTARLYRSSQVSFKRNSERLFDLSKSSEDFFVENIGETNRFSRACHRPFQFTSEETLTFARRTRFRVDSLF